MSRASPLAGDAGLQSNRGPRLERLLDERSRLRIQISIANDNRKVGPERVADWRRRLVLVENHILKEWSNL